MTYAAKRKPELPVTGQDTTLDPRAIKCIVFDFYRTLSSDPYFKLAPPGRPAWNGFFDKYVFFNDSPMLNSWMAGELTMADIARLVAEHVCLEAPYVEQLMERGCENLAFNAAVVDFAIQQKAQGRKTALVTANMDVFTKIVVPSHGLDKLFDVILNTADFGELRKECLWPIAFQRLGDGIDYHNSLLIEDGTECPDKFRARGGHAHQYHDDAQFIAWLEAVGMGSGQ